MKQKELRRLDKRWAAVTAVLLVTAVAVLVILGMEVVVTKDVSQTFTATPIVLAESTPPAQEAELVSIVPSDDIPLQPELQMQMMYWCEKYGIPVEVVLGVIETESGFRETALNGRCYGLMQVNSINLGWLNGEIGVTDLTDPAQNVHSGIYILQDLFGKYGDWHKALVCYNCGEAGAKRDVFDKGQTSSHYSEKVMARAEQWKEVIYR